MITVLDLVISMVLRCFLKKKKRGQYVVFSQPIVDGHTGSQVAHLCAGYVSCGFGMQTFIII